MRNSLTSLLVAARSRCAFALAGAIAVLGSLPVAAEETRLLWGDTHLHTSYSIDAYSTGNVNADPDTAYRFAKGLPVLHPSTRMRVRIDRPLDFLVVADHAEWLRLPVGLAEHDVRLLSTPSGQRLIRILEEGGRIFGEVGDEKTQRDLFTPEIRRQAWAAQVDLAEKHNNPGTFTTLIGWEWSAMPNEANLHRVVFTSTDGGTAKEFVPYSNMDSDDPEDLWQWLEETSERTGADFVAIPHNSNISKGLMFDMVDLSGRPISAEYARTRMRWEPVMEVTQVKGTSEVHPQLAPNDEFADFEIFDNLLFGGKAEPNGGAYARTALARGLTIEGRTGTNPYKLGMIGSSDSHTGLSSVEEDNFFGKLAADTLPEERREPGNLIFPAWQMSASGLAGIWAEENTREAIFAAFKRKEVYATTGPRIALRVFAGFDFVPADVGARDISAAGYDRGVPMGGDLAQAPEGKVPSLLIRAVKDPEGANLDRIQVIKGWLDHAGEAHTRVYDAVWSGQRETDKDGKPEAVKSTVDLETPSYTNSVGAAQLATVWTDPDFDPDLRAFYYVRVLEIPTPRHSVYDAAALQIDVAETGEPAAIQERAYSSPIWYTP